jgi:hypothetical protein
MTNLHLAHGGAVARSHVHASHVIHDERYTGWYFLARADVKYATKWLSGESKFSSDTCRTVDARGGIYQLSTQETSVIAPSRRQVAMVINSRTRADNTVAPVPRCFQAHALAPTIARTCGVMCSNTLALVLMRLTRSLGPYIVKLGSGTKDRDREMRFELIRHVSLGSGIYQPAVNRRLGDAASTFIQSLPAYLSLSCVDRPQPWHPNLPSRRDISRRVTTGPTK